MNLGPAYVMTTIIFPTLFVCDNLTMVFRNSLSTIKFKSSEGRKCLDMWKQSYLEVRKKIEQSGRDTRWEFDRKKLFERSSYISQVCSDIHDVAQVISMCMTCTCGIYNDHTLFL